MASRERSILVKLRTLLRAIDGTGSYTYDLSDRDDRVHIGIPPVGGPDIVPSVWMTAAEMNETDAPALGKHEQVLSVSFFGFVAGSDAIGESMLAAGDLRTDIRRALYADQTLGNLSLRLLVRSGTYDGAAMGMDQFGVCAGQIEITYRDGVD